MTMKPNKHEPESEPIIGDGTARFTMVLFLTLFTIGAAMLIWRGAQHRSGGRPLD